MDQKLKEEQLKRAARVLTVSARDYAESVGKRLTDYHMVGVYFRGLMTVDQPSDLERLFNSVPHAEVITDLRVMGENANNYFGTALLPKSN